MSRVSTACAVRGLLPKPKSSLHQIQLRILRPDLALAFFGRGGKVIFHVLLGMRS